MFRRAFVVVASCCALLACSSARGPADAAASGVNDANPAGPTCVGTRDPAPTVPTSPDADVLARAATVVGSCIPDDGIDRNLADMWHVGTNGPLFYERSVVQAQCLASAKCGCDAVKACLGYDLRLGTNKEVCKPCTGSVATLCETTSDDQILHFTWDCSAVGFACDELAGCAATTATACDSTSFAPACDSMGRPELCLTGLSSDAISYGPACGKLGLTCAGGQCVGSGAACSGGEAGPEGEVQPLGIACAGPQLDACVGGKRQLIDCAAISPGFSCESYAGHFFCGLGSGCLPGNEPGAVANTCEGDTVVLCNAGRVERIDCSSLGFSGCDVDPSMNHYGCIPGLTLR
jgi:hypothetical protein